VARDRQVTLERLVGNTPILKLKILKSSLDLNCSNPVHINCLGITGNNNEEIIRSSRKDGIVYFGYYPVDEIVEENEKSIDFNIPVESASIERSDHTNMYIILTFRGRHFLIEYNIDLNGYYMRDLGIGFGTFIRTYNTVIKIINLVIKG
jgi:hypothetical protein